MFLLARGKIKNPVRFGFKRVSLWFTVRVRVFRAFLAFFFICSIKNKNYSMLGTSNGLHYLRGLQDAPSSLSTPSLSCSTRTYGSGLDVIESFLQRAIDARDIAILTAGLRVAKDLIDANDPSKASLYDDVVAAGVITRAEGYLTVLQQQQLSLEAVEALALRRQAATDISTPRKGGDDVNVDAVNAFVDDFYAQYQCALLSPTTSNNNETAAATPSMHADTAMRPAAALVTPHSVVPPRPLKLPATDTSPPAEHLQVWPHAHPSPHLISKPTAKPLPTHPPICLSALSTRQNVDPHPRSLGDHASPESIDPLAEAGNYVAGAFAGIFYGVGTILGGEAAASPNTVATAVSVPTPEAAFGAGAGAATGGGQAVSGGGGRQRGAKRSPTEPSPASEPTFTGLPALMPAPPLRVSRTIGSSLMTHTHVPNPAPAPAPALTATPAGGHAADGLGDWGGGERGLGGREEGLDVDYHALAADFDGILTPPSSRRPPLTPTAAPGEGAGAVAGAGEKPVVGLGSTRKKSRPLVYDPLQVWMQCMGRNAFFEMILYVARDHIPPLTSFSPEWTTRRYHPP